MSTPLDNGAVLPHGLLSDNAGAMMEGFNKSYKNYPLRVGVITASYPVSDSRNSTKLTTEYDVLVIEQNADIGATTIQYKNCMSSEGLGSIADFFERALRPQKKKKNKGATNLNDQDGAIVLMLCLDGMSDKGIIIGQLTHPDRKTKLVDQGPLLVGEYNGVQITVNKDGSTSLVFKGATDSEGKPLDSKQGKTTAKIEKDGSFQIDHDSISFRLDRDGTTTLKGKKDIKLITDTNVNITTTKDVIATCENGTVTATKQVTVKCEEATVEATKKATIEGKDIFLGKGASEAVVKGDSFKKLFDAHIHPTVVGPSGPPTMPLAPTALSKKVKTE